MKNNMLEVCKELNIHPCEFLLGLQEIVNDVNEIYPYVDDVYVEKYKKMYGLYNAQDIEGKTGTKIIKVRYDIDNEGRELIKKMHGKKIWGKNGLYIDALRKLSPGTRDIKRTIKNLKEEGYLIEKKGKDNVYSLNTGRKREIVEIIEERKENNKNI